MSSSDSPWARALVQNSPCTFSDIGIVVSIGVSVLGVAWGIFITGSSLIGAAIKAPRITSKNLIRSRTCCRWTRSRCAADAGGGSGELRRLIAASEVLSFMHVQLKGFSKHLEAPLINDGNKSIIELLTRHLLSLVSSNKRTCVPFYFCIARVMKSCHKVTWTCRL